MVDFNPALDSIDVDVVVALLEFGNTEVEVAPGFGFGENDQAVIGGTLLSGIVEQRVIDHHLVFAIFHRRGVAQNHADLARHGALGEEADGIVEAIEAGDVTAAGEAVAITGRLGFDECPE